MRSSRRWLVLAAGLALGAVALAAGRTPAVGTGMQPVEANWATAEELQQVSGIGPAMAQRVLEARRERLFLDYADFAARVHGVGEKRAQRLSAAGLRVNGRRWAEAVPETAGQVCPPQARCAGKDS